MNAARRFTVPVLVSLCALAGALALVTTPALAASAHLFSKTFGGPCTVTPCGPGQFNEPAGVAVNDTTGDVYVVDKGDKRVEEFSSEGVFVMEFSGKGTAGELSEPEQIAVDNSGSLTDPSAGDLYVTDRGTGAVDKFSSTGEYKGQLTGMCEKEDEVPPTCSGFASFAALDGVAVDSEGKVWVYQESKQIAAFGDAEPNAFLSTRGALNERPAHPGFAVDSDDNLYIAHKWSGGIYVVGKLDSAGAVISEALREEESTGVAVDLSNNDVYLDSDGGSVKAIEGLTAGGLPVESFGSAQLSDGGGRGVAVNSATTGAASQTVYVADSAADDVAIYPDRALPVVIESESTSFLETTSVRLEAQINPGGNEVPYHFEYGPAAGSYDVSVPVPDTHTIASRTGVSVNVLAKGLAPGTTYHYRVVAVNAAGETIDGPDREFTTPMPAGNGSPPDCPNEQRRAEQPFGLTLPDCRAYEIVSPLETNGQDATDPFIGSGARASACAKECEERGDPAITYASRGSFADPNGAGIESQYLSRREPEHDRWSTQNITTPNQTLATETPFSYVSNEAFSPELTEGLALSNAQLTSEAPPHVGPNEYFLYLDDFAKGSYKYLSNEPNAVEASPDFSHVVVGISELVNGKLVPVTVANDGDEYIESSLLAVSADVYFTKGSVLYVRKNSEQPQSPLVNSEEADGTGTLTEGSHTVTSLATATGNIWIYSVGAGSSEIPVEPVSGKFLVGAGMSGAAFAPGTTITKVTKAPSGGFRDAIPGDILTLSTPTIAELESGNTISSDGPSPFAVGQSITGNGISSGTTITGVAPGMLTLSAPAASSGSVELSAGGGCTVAGDACTVEVSASQRLARNPGGPQPAQYWGASVDGSRAFFTSNAELTEDAYTGPDANAANLYEYDLESGKLNDLTGEETDASGEGAAVQGVVQISEDGQYVYFVAAGALKGAGGATLHNGMGEEPVEEEEKYNLYVSHDGGAPTFIATLAANDITDWEGGPKRNSAVVTPDGTRLAFWSERSLTGYDNEQAEPGECKKYIRFGLPGIYETGMCREIYLYEAETNLLVCASCNPTGVRPTGPSSLDYGEGTSYRSRNFAADGALFFDSSDALVPHASDGRQNVYEYEDGHIHPISDVAGGYESFFLDASESGDDVFFATADRLLPEVASNNVVVYDARVGGGFPVTVAPPACANADSCKPPVSPQPGVFGAPASATFSGSGNLAPPPLAVVKTVTKKVVNCTTGKKRNKRGKCVKRQRSKKTKAKRAGDKGRTVR